ncbi:MAG: hypothetical protein HY905_19695 [Deltaproteobacteria bacterium]|nr:hypothetical protein [Deltaproteobacteria bacterium]
MKRTLRPTLATVLALGWSLAGCSPEDGDSQPRDGGGEASESGGCVSTTPYCSSDGRDLLRCNPDTHLAEVLESCWPEQSCRLGACVTTVCPPGQSECVDDDTQRRCAADGSSWEQTDCAAGTRCSTDSGLCDAPCLLRIFVLIDQSGSMSETPASGGASKWDQARTAMQAVMTSPAAADIQWGMGLFPTDGDCSIDGMVIDPVPTASAASVDGYFASHGPDGNTPLAFAFEALTTETESGLYDPAYHNALLVVSDGVDTCYDDCATRCLGSPTPWRCMFDCAAAADTIVTESLVASTLALRDSRQVRTFVIGFGEGVSETQLTAIAENGGTVLGRWIPAGNIDDLTAALQTIVDEMWECNPIIII